ncbi:MAG TPA: squalene synthase HpnC [Pseudolabrys sp.]|nr:squalene synthase HpnC [Pseudolabrys sp.]
MIDSAQLRSGKGHHDENFPVASWVIRRRHRPVIHAFYEFVRVADDIADHPSLSADDKLAHLDRLEQSLLGRSEAEPEGVALRVALQSRGLSACHAEDVLRAFRQDVTKRRYADWNELIDYCSYSAAPVGRFVLDVHGELHSTWPASDALCAALQIINHLQDCAVDFRTLDRVYLPLDALAERGLSVQALGEARASPALLECLHALAARTAKLLEQSRDLSAQIRDARLAIEVSVIQALAVRLVAVLRERDPLSEPVHLGKRAVVTTAASGAARELSRLFVRNVTPVRRYQTP